MCIHIKIFHPVVCWLELVFKQHHPDSFVNILNEENTDKIVNRVTSVNFSICCVNSKVADNCLLYVTSNIVYFSNNSVI